MLHRLKLLQIFFPILWTINRPLQVTTQLVLRKVRKKYQDLWDLMRISVRKCILPELCMTYERLQSEMKFWKNQKN